MADESAPPDGADRPRLPWEIVADPGESRAAAEAFRLSEGAIAWARVLVVGALFPLVAVVPGPGTVRLEAGSAEPEADARQRASGRRQSLAETKM